jgi:hypothetical protein
MNRNHETCNVQIENEFGAFGYGDQPRDKLYLAHVRDKMSSLGIKSMYLTSDDPMITFDWGAIEGGAKVFLELLLTFTNFLNVN